MAKVLLIKGPQSDSAWKHSICLFSHIPLMIVLLSLMLSDSCPQLSLCIVHVQVVHTYYFLHTYCHSSTSTTILLNFKTHNCLTIIKRDIIAVIRVNWLKTTMLNVHVVVRICLVWYLKEREGQICTFFGRYTPSQTCKIKYYQPYLSHCSLAV